MATRLRYLGLEARQVKFKRKQIPIPLRGLALAYLGRSKEALRFANSLPDVFGSKDHFSGPMMGEKKAELLAVAGNEERAIDQLELMLSVSYANAITLWDLRLDPIWDPLREHPRFEALVAEDG